MPFDAKLFGEVFVTIVVIMDPVGNVPIFLALTGRMPAARRNRAAWQSVLVAGFVIGSFAVFGQQILDYLGISVAALQGAGGLLLAIVALELLMGAEEKPEGADVAPNNVALVPLGTPLLAGPGAIVATIVFVRKAHGGADATAIVAGLLAVHALLFVVLRFAGGILRLIKDSGVLLLTRISGLLLAAIAVQLVADSAIAFANGGAGSLS